MEDKPQVGLRTKQLLASAHRRSNIISAGDYEMKNEVVSPPPPPHPAPLLLLGDSLV